MSDLRCSHLIVQVLEFNPLGAAVSCTICGLTFDLSDQVIAESYFPFIYTSPQGKDSDVSLLVHEEVIK